MEFGDKRRGRRSALRFASAAALAAAAWAPSAHAATPQVVNIAAGPLEAALVALAGQTHQQLLYSPELVQGRRAPALSGRFTAEDAVQRLLGPGDIVVRRAGPNVLVLKRRTDPAAPAEAAADRPFVVSSSAASPAAAQPAAGPPAGAVDPAARDRTDATRAQDVAELTVIGSHIRGVRDGPSPVLVIDSAALERSGQLTVAAALAALPQNFAGNSTEGTVLRGIDRASTNNTFGTGISLRGLGSDATLVLVNGRRMAGAGVKGDFADVSSIPTAAVARVEILLDGASALYGSDAVGGVVNIILKQNFEGAETQVTVGSGTDGEPFEGRLSQTLGLAWKGGSGFVAYELHRREALAFADREVTASADLRPLGGTDHRQFFAHPGNIMGTDPATGVTVPRFAIPGGQNGIGLKPSDLIAGAVNLRNQNADLELLPLQTRHSLYAAARQEVGERVELLADVRYGYRRFRIEGGAPFGLVTVTRANPFFVSPTGATSHQVAYSFSDDLPSSVLVGSAESLGLSLGGEVRLPGAWRADGYVAFAQEIGKTHTGGLLNTTALNEATGATADRADTAFSATRDGFFNAFGSGPGTNNSAVLAFIGSGFNESRTRDRAYTVNLKADGELLELPAGPLRMAVGVQARREAFLRTGLTFQSGVAPTQAAGVDTDRTVLAGFAELRAPLVGEAQARPGLERLELSLAVRHEHYGDFGDTTNPKFGLIWTPTAGLRLHASYGRSFRAPSLRELRDPERYSPTLLPFNGPRVLTLFQSGGNPDLEPETATSWSLGADFTPVAIPGLRLTAGWFRIRFKDRIDQPAAQNVLTALTDPNLTAFVTRLSPATNPADRDRIAALIASPAFISAQGTFPAESYGAILDARYVNTAALLVEGLDLEGAYGWTVDKDRFTLSGNLSYLYDYRQQLTPTAPVQDLAGDVTYPAKLRARATLDWARGRFGGAVSVNYVSALDNPTGLDVDDYATFDLQARVTGATGSRLEGVRLLLNVRNLFDKAAPFYDSPAAIAYDAANADPIGRFVSIQLSRSW